MNTTQLSLYKSELTGAEKATPIKHGDILVTKPFGRVVVLDVYDSSYGNVYRCVRLDGGNECMVLRCEVLYRSR